MSGRTSGSEDPSAGHLGRLVAALVDGELAPDVRERALAHVAACARCGEEVRRHRETKARLSGLGPPALPEHLAARLSGLPGAPAGPRGPGRTPAPPRPGHRRRRQRRLGLAAAGASVLVVLAVGVVGAAFALGAPAQPAPTAVPPPVTPRVDAYVVQHAATTGSLPLGDPAAAVVETAAAQR